MDTNQSATGTFLRAEEIAARLADELVRLDQESRDYSGATTTLATAGEQLRSLAEAVRDNSARTADVITAIREVGSPAIVDGLGRVDASVSRASDALEKLDHLAAEHAANLAESHHAISASLSELNAAGDARLDRTRTAIADAVTALQQDVTREGAAVRGDLEALTVAVQNAQTAVSAQVEALRRESREMSEAQGKRVRMGMILAACAALLAAAATIIPLVR